MSFFQLDFEIELNCNDDKLGPWKMSIQLHCTQFKNWYINFLKTWFLVYA